MKPVIIVQSGAKTISEDKVTANHAGCRMAVETGWAILQSGGNVATAVEAAIRVLESDQTFNAGLGSPLISEEQYQEWQEEAEVLDRPNTVGCVALDRNSNLVAGTSTGAQQDNPRGEWETLLEWAVACMPIIAGELAQRLEMENRLFQLSWQKQRSMPSLPESIPKQRHSRPLTPQWNGLKEKQGVFWSIGKDVLAGHTTPRIWQWRI